MIFVNSLAAGCDLVVGGAFGDILPGAGHDAGCMPESPRVLEEMLISAIRISGPDGIFKIKEYSTLAVGFGKLTSLYLSFFCKMGEIYL